VKLELPDRFPGVAKIRLRVPNERKLQSVLLNGASWKDFTADGIITIPRGERSEISITANY